MNKSRTYKLEETPDKAISWNKYKKLILEEWDVLLSKEPAATEPEIQTFLEKYPCMIPGAFGPSFNPNGHYPHFCGVVSQAPLPSYDKRVPDFIWLSKNSDTEQPVLVEIEKPSKRWFRNDGQQTAEFTQALTQISEWKAWFGVSHNVEAFKHFYGLDCDARNCRLRPAYLLIYGRRAEISANPTLIRKKAYLFPEDVVGMTYDRLEPNPSADQLVCIKSDVSRTFSVISVPASLKWSPVLAGERAKVSEGWIEAIESNEYISDPRKKFLIERHQYWENWGSSGTSGTINAADEE